MSSRRAALSLRDSRFARACLVRVEELDALRSTRDFECLAGLLRARDVTPLRSSIQIKVSEAIRLRIVIDPFGKAPTSTDCSSLIKPRKRREGGRLNWC